MHVSFPWGTTKRAAEIESAALAISGQSYQLPLTAETLLPQSAEHALRSIPFEDPGYALVLIAVELTLDGIGIKEGSARVTERPVCHVQVLP